MIDVDDERACRPQIWPGQRYKNSVTTIDGFPL